MGWALIFTALIFTLLESPASDGGVKALSFLTGLMSAGAHASVAENPLDVRGMDQTETRRHLESVRGQPLQIAGVVKDASDIRGASRSVLYEIPAYWRDGSQYVRYGIVCQRVGEAAVIFADDGYLSPFVKKNVLDRPVFAEGRVVEGGKVAGLPRGIVFIIDSLRLQDSGGGD